MSIHTCSYYCDRPECIRAQRDELRQKLEQVEKRERLSQFDPEPIKEKNGATAPVSE